MYTAGLVLSGSWDKTVKLWDNRAVSHLVSTIEQPERVYAMDLAGDRYTDTRWLSAISWTIIFAKWLEYRRVRSTGSKFVQEFERVRTMEDAARLAARGKPNPFTRVFMRAHAFLTDTTPALGPTCAWCRRGIRLLATATAGAGAASRAARP